MPNRFEAVELTAEQAWYLAEELGAGTYPWKLAITPGYYDLADRDDFDQRCRAELVDQRVIDDHGNIHAGVAAAVRTLCRSHQWLEWLTIIDEQQIMRGVLARGPKAPNTVVALRNAQMVTITAMDVAYTEAIVPIITVGLPDQPPAQFDEFSLPMDTGKSIDSLVAGGADMVELLTGLGVAESDAEVMEFARAADRITVELTAHEAINGARYNTDVSVNIFNTAVGRILVSPPAGEPRAGGESLFAPGDPFSIAVAVRDLTARLPDGPWFPDDHFAD